jgi:ComF family protein
LRLSLDTCPRCGCPTEESEQGCWCQPATRAALTGLRAAAYYEGPLRKAIHQLKFKNDMGLAEALASLLHDCWRDHGLSADWLVPVPLSRQRLQQRGYNQAALLAESLAALAGVPMAPAGIERVRDTVSQIGSPWGERWAHVTGAFKVAAGREHWLAGQRVALVDDVCTTGATLTACATALREAGAVEVWGVALARPRRNHGIVVQ